MSNGNSRLVIPRHDPINAITMGAIARDAGLTPEQFRQLLGRLRAQGSCLSKSGDPLAARAGDSGGVAARLSSRTPAVVSHTGCCLA